MDTEFGESMPVLDHHIGVYQRRFDVQAQVSLLLFRGFRHQIRDHHVVARHDGLTPFDAMRFAVINVGHDHAIIGIGRINHNAAQANAGAVLFVVEFLIIQPGGDGVFHRVAR